MFWNPLKWPIALAVLLGVLGIGAATTAQQNRQGLGHQPAKPARAKEGKPEPAEKADDLQSPFELPLDAFPEVKDDDAPEKIRAAQQAYDDQLHRLARESGEIKGDMEILETEIDALKKAFGANLSTIRKEQGGDQKAQEIAKVTADELRREIRYSSVKLEEARRRSDDVDERLLSLKKRPRPIERLEIQPGDIIRVEVLEALPGRPITGEHVIRPDGMLSLGFYGKIYVAGLTTDEIKEKVILKLRKLLPDETLGLVVLVEDEKTGKMKPTIIQPKDSDRAYVDLILQPK